MAYYNELEKELNGINLSYHVLIKSVKNYLDAKDKVAKTKSKQDYAILFAYEKKMKELVTPKESSFEKFLKQ